MTAVAHAPPIERVSSAAEAVAACERVMASRT
jgi:hypothetical protein